MGKLALSIWKNVAQKCLHVQGRTTIKFYAIVLHFFFVYLKIMNVVESLMKAYGIPHVIKQSKEGTVISN